MQGNSELKLLNSADNMPITLNQWLEHYNNNPGMYHFILVQNCIIQKNGKRSYSQKQESETTTKNYTILYSDIEDIKQQTLLNVVKYFKKYQTVKYQYKYIIYRQALIDALRTHIKQIRRFNIAADQNQKTAWVNGERVITTNIDYNSSDIKIDIKRILTSKQYKVLKMILLKYTYQEIANSQKITRQAVYKQVNQIRKIIQKEYLLNDIAEKIV